MNFSLKNTLSLLVVKGCTIGLRLFLMFLLAQALSPTAFAPIAFIFTAAEILRLVLDLGLDTYLLREHSLDAQRVPLNEVIVAKLGAMLAFAPLLYLVHHWLNPALTAVDWLLIFGFGCMPLLQNVSAIYLQAQNRLLSLLPIYTGFSVVALGLLLLIVHVGYLSHALPTLLGIEFLIALFSLLLTRKQWRGRSYTLGDIVQYYRHSLAIGFAIIIGASYARLDILMLTKLSTAHDVGNYALANRTMDPLLFVAGAFFSDLYAKMSAMAMNRTNHTQQIRFLNRSFLLAATLTVGYAALVGLLIHTFAPLYRDAVQLIIPIAMATVFKMRNLSYSAFINAKGRYHWMSRLAVVNFLIVALYLYVGISHWGVWGAAMAVALAEMTNSVMQYWLVHRLRSTTLED